jgi:hypothetical protein
MGMSEITEQYFLMEVTKNMDIKMPKKLKKDFLNIDGEEKKKETRTGEINVESKLKERKEELRNFTFEFLMPTDFNQMVQKFKSMVHTMSVSPFNRDGWSEWSIGSHIPQVNTPKVNK